MRLKSDKAVSQALFTNPKWAAQLNYGKLTDLQRKLEAETELLQTLPSKEFPSQDTQVSDEVQDTSQQATTQSSQSSDPHPLYVQLIKLLMGDETAANRLLRQVRSSHSEKSEQWYYEKVIEDLKRDRRSY